MSQLQHQCHHSFARSTITGIPVFNMEMEHDITSQPGCAQASDPATSVVELASSPLAAQDMSASPAAGPPATTGSSSSAARRSSSFLDPTTESPAKNRPRVVSLEAQVAKILSDDFQGFDHESIDVRRYEGKTLRETLTGDKAKHKAKDA
eukprot:11043281-Alexandrium_andersonii.AAC.1